MFKVTNIYTVLFSIVLCFIVSSCQKEKTKTELLTGKTWKMSGFNINPGLPNPNGGSPITDFYTQLSACDKDDLWKYNIDKKYTVDEGASKCNASSPQISEAGTWTFNATESLLVTTSGTTVTELTIAELSATSLKLNITEVKNGINYTFSLTFEGL